MLWRAILNDKKKLSLFPFKVHLHHSSNKKSHKDVTKPLKSRFSITFLLVDGMIRIHTNKLRMRNGRPKNIRIPILNTGQNCHRYFNHLATTEQNATERYRYLKILPDVGLEHSLEALHWILHRKGSEKVHQPIWKQIKNETTGKSILMWCRSENSASHLITGNWIGINVQCCLFFLIFQNN
jgi:hypothetical protein